MMQWIAWRFFRIGGRTQALRLHPCADEDGCLAGEVPKPPSPARRTSDGKIPEIQLVTP